MSDRADIIREMLSRYHEAQAQAKGEGGLGGQFSSAMLTWDHETYTREYRELDRCLNLLRLQAEGGAVFKSGTSARRVWWAIRERYLHCTLVQREVHTYRTKSGHRVPKPLPAGQEVVSRQVMMLHGKATAIVRVWDDRVDSKLVDEGVRWLAGEFRGRPSTGGIA